MAQSNGRVHDTVRRYILDTFVYDPDDQARVSDDLPLIDEGILDSFGIHEVLLYLESEFSISIDEGEVLSTNFGSIGAITAFVRQKTQAD